MSLFTPFVSHALAAGLSITPTGTPSASGTNPTTTINNIYDIIFRDLTLIAGVLAVLYLIWYGIQYITSGGSPDKVKTARTGIINSIIGIIIIVAAYTIIKIAVGFGDQFSGAAS